MAKSKKEKELKIYFSIKEVADEIGVNQTTLRFWEKEFDFIRPKTNAKGVRFYKQEDIDDIRLVHYLVKEKGMTLAGARQKLKDNKDTAIREEEIVHKLQKIKEELLSLKEAFDSLDNETVK